MMPVLPPDEVFKEVFIEILCKSKFNTCVFLINTSHVMYLIKFFVIKFYASCSKTQYLVILLRIIAEVLN